MVLLLFLLALTIGSSWQEDITEKNLNQMLDQLIEETVLTYSNENENNSRIIYIKSDNATRRTMDSKPNIINSNEYTDIEKLVNDIENSRTNHQLRDGDEITVQIEHNSGHYHINDGDQIQDIEIMSNEILKSGRPFEDGVNNVVVLGSDPESNLIHKYPEIIIDKISYDATNNQNKVKEEPPLMRQSNAKHLTAEEKKEVAAKALDSLMQMIIKGTPKRKSLDVSKENEPEDASNTRRATHIHNAYHNHVINNVPLPYSGVSPRGKMSLGKLPEGYRDLHRIINRPMSAYLDTNLQLTRWGGNAGQNPLMSISRAHNRNRVHFIPDSLNIVPRIVYQPVFQRQYSG